MIIDFEHHLSTEGQLRRRGSKSDKIGRGWDKEGKVQIKGSWEAARVDSHLRFMDEAGIDMAVLTTNMCNDLDEAREWNDFCAKVVRENPKRFVGFAITLPLGGAAAFEEMERAINELGMKGVHIQARIEGRTLDSRELWPFYEKVSELRIPVDVHIEGDPPGFDALRAPYALYYVIAREFDMCAAVLRVCLGGILEDFPDLVFIMNHFGGGISAVKERVDIYTDYLGEKFYQGVPLINKPWTEYFNKLYFNMAGREAGIDAARCALTNISPRRLVFGTDWPWNYEGNPQGVRGYVEKIRKLDLSEDDIDAMLGGAAARLLRL